MSFSILSCSRGQTEFLRRRVRCKKPNYVHFIPYGIFGHLQKNFMITISILKCWASRCRKLKTVNPPSGPHGANWVIQNYICIESWQYRNILKSIKLENQCQKSYPMKFPSQWTFYELDSAAALDWTITIWTTLTSIQNKLSHNLTNIILSNLAGDRRR